MEEIVIPQSRTLMTVRGGEIHVGLAKEDEWLKN